MRLLLDTHILLWSLSEPEKIEGEAARVFRDQPTTTVISAVSLWEISIKRAAGKLEAPDDLPRIIEGLGHEMLPVRASHAWRAGGLPHHHKNPFDRLLVAQAMEEGLTLVSRDQTLMSYDVRVLRA